MLQTAATYLGLALGGALVLAPAWLAWGLWR